MINIKHLSFIDLILLKTSLTLTKKVAGEHHLRFDNLIKKVDEGLTLYIQKRDPYELKQEIHGVGLIMGKDDPDLKEVCTILEQMVQLKIDLHDKFKGYGSQN